MANNDYNTKLKHNFKLRFTPAAWGKLIVARDYINNVHEIGFMGIAHDPKNPLLIHDLFIPKQKVEKAYVDFDEQSISDYIEEQFCDHDRQPYQCGRVWLHTHPMNSATPSAKDEETFEEAWPDADFAVMFILANDNSKSCRLKMKVKGPNEETMGRMEMNIPVILDWHQPLVAFDAEAWLEELEDKCIDEAKLFQINDQESWLQTSQVAHDKPGYYQRNEKGIWRWVEFTKEEDKDSKALDQEQEPTPPKGTPAVQYTTADSLGLTRQKLVEELLERRKKCLDAYDREFDADSQSSKTKAIKEHARLYEVACYAEQMEWDALDYYSKQAKGFGLTHLEAYFNEWMDHKYLVNAGDSSQDADVQEQVAAEVTIMHEELEVYGANATAYKDNAKEGIEEKPERSMLPTG